MTRQSEQILENNLVQQLKELGYAFVKIEDEQALLSNLKSQLEKHNNQSFSKTEFVKILNYLNKGNIFDRAKTLRDKFQFIKDDGKPCYIEFIEA